MIYSRLRLGDTVTIEALPDIKYAKSVSVAPFQDTIEGLSGEVFVKPYFSNKFLPLKVGDTFLVRGGMRQVEFKVFSVEMPEDSAADYCIVGEDTTIYLTDDALGREEDDRLGTVLQQLSDDVHNYMISLPYLSPYLSLSNIFRTRIIIIIIIDIGEIGYDDIGGCDKQLAQIRELVELPLRHPQIFQSVGIPP